MNADDWEPGDPLNVNPSLLHQSGLFSFRVDALTEDRCNCPDAASWPEPLLAKSLDKSPDELEVFIAEWHEWQRGGAA